MTTRSNAHRKAVEPGENSTARGSNAPLSYTGWEGRGQQSHGSALSSGASVSSAEPNPVDQTDHDAVAVCFDKQGLARFLDLSVRSLDRANAAGLLPCPDLVCGRSPRWSPATIERWLRTRPVFPGRGRRP